MIDLAQYKTDAHSYSGSDNKHSIYMNGKYYMVKHPNANESDNSLKTSISNNVISEYVGSHIMQALGLEAQNTLLGMWNDEVVVACEDFREEGWELHEFSWYMQDILPKYQIGRIPTYEQLYKVHNECDFLKDISQQAIEKYWDIIVGDTLLGNFDRHKDNFGFLTNKTTKEIKPSPIYDCGSCLYPSLKEDKFQYILSSPDEIKKRIYEFPKIALNKNSNKNKEDKFGYFELLSSNYDKEYTRAFFALYHKLDIKKAYEIIDDTPFISDVRKDFYKKMLTYRKELIMDKAYDMLIENPEIKKNAEYYFSRCEGNTGKIMAKCFQLQKMGSMPLSLFSNFAPKTYTFTDNFPEHEEKATKTVETSITHNFPSKT